MTRLSVTSITALTFIGAIVLGVSGCHSQDAPPPQAASAAAAPVAAPVSLRAKGEAKMREEAAAYQAKTPPAAQ